MLEKEIDPGRNLGGTALVKPRVGLRETCAVLAREGSAYKRGGVVACCGSWKLVRVTG